MKTNQKLTYAITAVLSAYAGASFAAADNLGIEEVVVTAQRRSENIQNVPITMQAMSSETLSQLNVTTIEDMVKYLPNVSTATIGPGQGNIYMRGLSVGAGGTQGLGSIGNYPNVAVYLDDQPTQLPGRNLDVYAADMERIEVLEGPQGTLFGAGAQAGVVRYITNKPKIDKTEGKATMGYGTTAHGDPNSSLEGMLNLPLIDGTLAVRAVVYSDRRGGYIDNQASTLTRFNTDYPWAHGTNGGQVPTDNVVGNNYAIAGSATNPLTYQGMRLSGLLKINEDWDVLLTQSYQKMDAQGVFYQQPVGLEGNKLPTLTNTTFSPSYDKDQFTNTALTVNGKIGALKAVYSGAYLVRNVDQVQDYSGYARGVYGYYYQCAIDYVDSTKSKCYSPVTNWHDVERNTVQTHEFRLTTPDDLRVRATMGLFYEKMEIEDDTAWNYRTVPNCSPTQATYCYHPTQPFPGQPVLNPSSFNNPNLGFSDAYTRNFSQKAAFASVDFDLIPKQLTLTLGTRYYNMHDTRVGGDPGSFDCLVGSTPTTDFGPCSTAVQYGNLQTGADQTEKGFKSRVNITWRPMDDTMLYATWSQGYRPGGFNRSTSIEPIGNGSYQSPAAFSGDELINKEIGWKTELLNRRVQFNGAIYQEDWKNTQVGLFAPELGFGNLTFGLNGPTFRVKGLETQIIARVTEGLTLTGSASWNSSSQQNAPQLLGNVPGSEYYNQLLPTGGLSPFGKPGANLAMSPPFQANLRARYEWTLGSYNAFWQLGGVHTAHSFTTTGTIDNFELPAWTTYDGSAGVAKDNWTAEIFGSNLTNVNTVLFESSTERVVSQVPTRPRVLGLRLSFKF